MQEKHKIFCLKKTLCILQKKKKKSHAKEQWILLRKLYKLQETNCAWQENNAFFKNILCNLQKILCNVKQCILKKVIR